MGPELPPDLVDAITSGRVDPNTHRPFSPPEGMVRLDNLVTLTRRFCHRFLEPLSRHSTSTPMGLLCLFPKVPARLPVPDDQASLQYSDGRAKAAAARGPGSSPCVSLSHGSLKEVLLPCLNVHPLPFCGLGGVMQTKKNRPGSSHRGNERRLTWRKAWMVRPRLLVCP